MKKTIALILAMLLALCQGSLSLAEDAEGILTEEAWVNSGGTRWVLNEGGTATLIYPTMSQEAAWTFENGKLVLSYESYGQRTQEYDLVPQGDYWVLTNASGGLFMRESEYDAAMAAAGDGSNAYAMAMGEEIALPFLKFTLTEAGLTDTVGNDKQWISCADGYRFFCLRGTAQNLFNEELEFNRARAQFTFNGDLLFSGSVRLLTEDVLRTKLSPMSTGDLFLYASLPQALVDTLDTASVLFAFNENLATAPMFAPEGEYQFRLDMDHAVTAQAREEPAPERVTFEECPSLPTPMSFDASLFQSGHNSGSVNGKVTHIHYSYASHKSGADLSALAAQYLDGLRAEGFGVEERGGECEVLHGSDRVATVTVDDKAIRVELVPGNEGLAGAPVPPAEADGPAPGIDASAGAEEAARAAATGDRPQPERVYDDRETVKKVQQALNDAGFNCGKPDGVAGKNTKKAIGDFQAANGLERTETITDPLLSALGLKEDGPAPAEQADAPGEKVVDTDAGTLVIKGYAMDPKGFKGFSNTHEYDGYSIFTVHAVLTVKGDEPQSSWSTFKTQAFQNGVDARSYTDFDKKTRITTDILPNTPVEIDLDFLVESPEAPVTFMVSTWGRSKIVFQEEIDPAKLGK